MEEEVIRYFDGLFAHIEGIRQFFIDQGRLNCFSFNFSSYNCHLCSISIPIKKTPGQFITEIMFHLRKCKNRILNTSISEHEFSSQYSVIKKVKESIIESLKYLEKHDSKNLYTCKICKWHSMDLPIKNRTCSLIERLANHVLTYHESGFIEDNQKSQVYVPNLGTSAYSYSIKCEDYVPILDKEQGDIVIEKVTNYLDELLKAVSSEKEFFMNEGGFYSFIFESSSYRCHICNSEIPLEESPGLFVKNVIFHINSCRRSKLEEKLNKIRSKEIEYSDTYDSLLNTSKLIKESLFYLENDSSKTEYYCTVCKWSALFPKKNFIAHLYKFAFHVETYHRDGFLEQNKKVNSLSEIRERHINTDQADTSDATIPLESLSHSNERGYAINAHLNSLVDEYLDKLLKAIATKRNFFITKGKLNGFSFSSWTYQCHLCNIEILLKKNPDTIIKQIFKHVYKCKSRKCENESDEITERKDVEFSFFYNYLLRISSLIKESLQFLEEDLSQNNYCCRLCNWSCTIFSEKQFNKNLHTLVFHVQKYHVGGFRNNNKNIVPVQESVENKIHADEVNATNLSNQSSPIKYPIKDNIQINVADYLDRLLQGILENKYFFINKGRLYCLDFNSWCYQCHLCNEEVLPNSDLDSFVQQIINHVNQCKYNKFEDYPVELNKVADDKGMDFSVFYNCLFATGALIKENIKLLFKKDCFYKRYCKTCNCCCSLLFEKEFYKHIHHFVIHMYNENFKGFEYFDEEVTTKHS